MAGEFHGNPRIWIVATLLLPESVPINICSWILSLITMVLDLWYPEGMNLTTETVKGDETRAVGKPGWKVVYLKWYTPPAIWALPPGQQAPEGEFDPKDLLEDGDADSTS